MFFYSLLRLKLGIDFQYVLNSKGSSPAEVLGINYKSILKPALVALSEDTKKISVSKLEESITLQEQSQENAKILEEKRNNLASFQAKIDEVLILLYYNLSISMCLSLFANNASSSGSLLLLVGDIFFGLVLF